MKSKILLTLLMITLVLPLTLAGTVERSFSQNNINVSNTITVSLEVTADGSIAYSISEMVPTGWTVLNDGTGTLQGSGDEIRWIEFSPTNEILQYTIQAPTSAGSYEFLGTAIFDINPEQNISGETEVNVTIETTTTPEIKINEFVSDPNGIGDEWIELFNPTGSTVDLTDWTIEDATASPNSLTGKTIPSLGYLVLEKNTLDFTFGLNNPGDIIILKSSGEEVDKVSYGDYNDGNTADNAPEGTNGESTGRLPNGIDTNTDKNDFVVFTTPTKNSMNILPEASDDLMVNYLRGRIIIEGQNATAGQQYKVEVLTGANAGQEFIGQVDDNIPSAFQGQGFFDTLDQLKFSTGNNFRVSISGYSCEDSGTFDNGGNGNFESGIGLVEVICNLPNNPPILAPIGDKIVNEQEVWSFTVAATDIDNDTLTFYATNLPIGSSFVDMGDYGLFSWIPSPLQSGIYPNIEFIVSDAEDIDSETITITVTDLNHDPILDEIPNKTINEDQKISFLVHAIDLDFDEITYSISNENVLEVDCKLIGTNLTITPSLNWIGNATCEVNASDEKGGADTQTFNIEVIPVNDLPEFLGELQDIFMDEDTCLTNHLDLLSETEEGYFSDPDSTLELSVTGNWNINITLTNGKVSICPEKDFIGSRIVVFEAKESENESNFIYSNSINITVNDLPEPPVIDPILDINVMEDSGESNETTLNATDPDGTIDRFEVQSETLSEVDCKIIGNKLTVTPGNDFFGQAACLIRVYDNSNSYDETSVTINVQNINDAPEIEDFSPNQPTINVLENVDHEFSVTVTDKDNDPLITTWLLNGTQEGTGTTFNFNKPKGEYPLAASVSDGALIDTQLWSINVLEISELTCSEVSGFECTGNDICTNQILNVKDTDSCCSSSCIEGPPAFSDVDRCEILNSKIKIKITEPDSGDNFNVGETINGEVQIENNFDEDLDFDVDISFYNIDDDDDEENFDDSVDVDEGDKEKIEFSFDIPISLNNKDDYAIFVKVEEEDGLYCNEEYTLIDIEREDHNVIIEKIIANPLTALCGDTIDLNVDLKNIGNKDEEAYIEIKNSELEISLKSEEIEIEEFDEDDEYTETFFIKLPESAEEGVYTLKVNVIFDDGSEKYTQEEEISLGECKALTEEVTEEVLTLNANTSLSQQNTRDYGTFYIILFALGLLILGILVIYLVFLFFR
jgi:hypothetical protein